MTQKVIVIGTIWPNINLTLVDAVGDEARLRHWESFFSARVVKSKPTVKDGQNLSKGVTLVISSKGLLVALDDRPDFEPFGFDFTHPILLNRLRTTGRANPLVKALGSTKAPLRVFDATLGQCFDALVFAKMGHFVFGVERNPTIYALAEDAMSRARDSKGLLEILNLDRISIKCGDSGQQLGGLDREERPQVIYLDPMFPEEATKTALPRKEIQIFRALAGDDEDAQQLLEIALHTATERVIVKRPSSSPPLFKKVTHSFESKLVRYDMYLTDSGVHL